MKIEIIPCLNDNYSYLIHDHISNTVAIVDPSEFMPCDTIISKNYKKLDLASFYAGSLVRYKDCFHLMSDPFRNPLDGILSLANPIGTVLDKVNIGLLRTGLRTMSSYADSTSTADALDNFGFSASIKERFLAPFLRAVFLEPELSTSVRKFDEVFKNFANGEIAVPSMGISSIPKQLGSSLSSDELKLNAPVSNINRNII